MPQAMGMEMRGAKGISHVGRSVRDEKKLSECDRVLDHTHLYHVRNAHTTMPMYTRESANPSLLSARESSCIEPQGSLEGATKLDGSLDTNFSTFLSYNLPPSSSAPSYTIVIAFDRWIRCRAMYQATLKAKSTIRKLPPSCGSDCHGRTLPPEEFARNRRLHPRFIACFTKNCNRRDNKCVDSFQLERHVSPPSLSTRAVCTNDPSDCSLKEVPLCYVQNLVSLYTISPLPSLYPHKALV